MKQFWACVVILQVFTSCNLLAEEPDGNYIIGTIEEQGYPVIYKLIPYHPEPETITKYPWLTVVSWEYSKTVRNGMPPEKINQDMIALEDAFTEEFEDRAGAKWVYNRTGNGRKEFVYYIQNRTTFTAALNWALATHKRYPIEITFYDDTTWQDFIDLVEIFEEAKLREKDDT